MIRLISKLKMLLDKRNTGFVLLFSVLVSSVILAAALAISRIVTKEVLLASVGRDSQQAFFAADAGADCAIYWSNHGAFDPGTTAGSNIYCNSQTITDGQNNSRLVATNWAIILADPIITDLVASGEALPQSNKNTIGSSKVSVFALDTSANPNATLSPSTTGSCALILIDNTTPGVTSIVSRGYNTCLDTRRRVERALEVTITNSRTLPPPAPPSPPGP